MKVRSLQFSICYFTINASSIWYFSFLYITNISIQRHYGTFDPLHCLTLHRYLKYINRMGCQLWQLFLAFIVWHCITIVFDVNFDIGIFAFFDFYSSDCFAIAMDRPHAITTLILFVPLSYILTTTIFCSNYRKCNFELFLTCPLVPASPARCAAALMWSMYLAM